MTEFRIEDMTCNHCAATITKAVHALDQAATVEIDLPAKRVQVKSPVDPAKLADAIRGAGFTPMQA
jgi:copper chaperone